MRKLFFTILVSIITCNKINESSDNESSIHGSVFSGFSLIFVSEILDRTFFLNMIYGLTHSFLKTFIISSFTLLSLNLLALILGKSLPFFLYQVFIEWIAIAIFMLFGVIMIHDYFYYKPPPFLPSLAQPLMSGEISDIDTRTKSSLSLTNEPAFDTTWSFITSLILAECGDKSQITAILIGAVHNFTGVLIGTSLGYMSCIILAISLGNFLSQKVSRQNINLLSGIVFISFAVSYIIHIIG